MTPLAGQLILGTLLIISAAVFHIYALVLLAKLLPRINQSRFANSDTSGLSLTLIVAVLGIVAIHTIEAWSWAVVYILTGEFASLQDALYFSVVTATTLGYGDFTLSERWQILGSFEAMGGLILFGASTAFLIEVIRETFKTFKIKE